MLRGVDAMVHVVRQGRDRFANALPVRTVPDPARGLRDQRALHLFLQVEHGSVVIAAQSAPKRRHLTPRRWRSGRAAPAPQRDRDDPPHIRIERDDFGERLLGDPVDGDFRPVPPHVGDQCERVNDVAQRRGADDQQGAHPCGLRTDDDGAMPVEGRPREQGIIEATRGAAFRRAALHSAKPRRMRAIPLCAERFAPRSSGACPGRSP